MSAGLGLWCGAAGCSDVPAPPNEGTESSTGSGTGDVADGTGSDSGSSGGEDGFAGLSAPVDIFIDDRGIPHIYGQTDLDVMYAAGYQQATDRLFQMDLMRRRALGTQAAVLGPGFVGSDELSRLFDFRRWGAANVQRLREESPETLALLEAWVEGVNRRIEEVRAGTAPLPYGFGPGELDYLPEPYTLDEHSAIAKLLFFGNSNSLERELLTTIMLRNFPEPAEEIELPRPMWPVTTMPADEVPASAATAVPPLASAPRPPIDATPEQIAEAIAQLRTRMSSLPRVGSNNWAIDGRHTADGVPLIAGDPHQPLQSPSLMYTQHLNSADAGGSIDLIGWAFTGAAGVHLGHNRHVQWTATTNFADVMDIWEVTDNDGTVDAAGTAAEVVARNETIEVAGEASRTYVVRDVPGYGVILPNNLLPLPVAGFGNALLLNWTGFAATNEERCFMDMARASNLDEYEAAVDLMEVGGFNFVAATAEGITYRVNILVPDRGDPSARPMPFSVLDGNDADSYWSGYLPPQQLPRSRAEGTGWVATANNDPWGFTFDGDVSNDPWYYGYFYASGNRAKRIADELERLTARGGLTIEDMQALQMDTYSPMAEALLPPLAQAHAAIGTDPALDGFADDTDLDTLVQLLTVDWDGRMDRDSAGALAFHVFMLLLTEEAVGDELSVMYETILGEEASFLIKMPGLAVTGAYPQSDALLEGGRDLVLLTALRRTAQLLVDRYGDVDPAGYAWGDLHGTFFTSSFGGDQELGFVSTPGGEDTVNVSSSRFLSDGEVAERFESRSGSIFRVVSTFDGEGVPQAWAVFPPGNSAEPSSPHYDDTLDDWVEGVYAPLPFARAEVDASVTQTITLSP